MSIFTPEIHDCPDAPSYVVVGGKVFVELDKMLNSGLSYYPVDTLRRVKYHHDEQILTTLTCVKDNPNELTDDGSGHDFVRPTFKFKVGDILEMDYVPSGSGRYQALVVEINGSSYILENKTDGGRHAVSARELCHMFDSRNGKIIYLHPEPDQPTIVQNNVKIEG